MKRLIILLVAVAASAVWSAGSPAAAHDDKGVLTLVRSAPVSGGVEITVSLVYSGDREPVDDADVTVEVLSPTPVPAAPMTFSGTPGTYTATLAISPDAAAQLRLASSEPAATTNVEVKLAGDATASTTAATSSPTPDSASSATVTVASTAATSTTLGDVATPGTNADEGSGEDGDDDGLSTPAKVAIALVFGAVAVGVGLYGVRSRRNKQT